MLDGKLYVANEILGIMALGIMAVGTTRRLVKDNFKQPNTGG